MKSFSKQGEGNQSKKESTRSLRTPEDESRNLPDAEEKESTRANRKRDQDVSSQNRVRGATAPKAKNEKLAEEQSEFLQRKNLHETGVFGEVEREEKRPAGRNTPKPEKSGAKLSVNDKKPSVTDSKPAKNSKTVPCDFEGNTVTVEDKAQKAIRKSEGKKENKNKSIVKEDIRRSEMNEAQKRKNLPKDEKSAEVEEDTEDPGDASRPMGGISSDQSKSRHTKVGGPDIPKSKRGNPGQKKPALSDDNTRNESKSPNSKEQLSSDSTTAPSDRMDKNVEPHHKKGQRASGESEQPNSNIDKTSNTSRKQESGQETRESGLGRTPKDDSRRGDSKQSKKPGGDFPNTEKDATPATKSRRDHR